MNSNLLVIFLLVFIGAMFLFIISSYIFKKKIKKITPKHIKDGHTKFNIYKFFRHFKLKFFTSKSTIIVARMQLINGDSEDFPVQVNTKSNSKSFKLFGKRYLVDDKYLRYNRTYKLYTSMYHENICLPIDFFVESDKIVQSLERENLDENITSNVDPYILETFTKSTVIQKVFAGAELQDMFGFFKILLIISMLISSVSAVGILHMNGVF